ncbi:hypothetical protein AGR1B_Cc140083 [Agrobacterium fabacearum S56]|nr:hypothetical protein AGR1B_Cc140083 [Agrobacterium fabacearum S56]
MSSRFPSRPEARDRMPPPFGAATILNLPHPAIDKPAALTVTPVQPKGKALTVFSRQREKLRGNTVPPHIGSFRGCPRNCKR